MESEIDKNLVLIEKLLKLMKKETETVRSVQASFKWDESTEFHDNVETIISRIKQEIKENKKQRR